MVILPLMKQASILRHNHSHVGARKRQYFPGLFQTVFFKKMGHPHPLFRLFSSFQTKQYIFYNK